MEVHLYRVIANNHMADGIFAYAPAARVVAEGDLVDEGWDIVWWGNSYPDSVNYWKLQVEKDLPVHGNVHTYGEVIELLKKQTKTRRISAITSTNPISPCRAVRCGTRSEKSLSRGLKTRYAMLRSVPNY